MSLSVYEALCGVKPEGQLNETIYNENRTLAIAKPGEKHGNHKEYYLCKIDLSQREEYYKGRIPIINLSKMKDLFEHLKCSEGKPYSVDKFFHVADFFLSTIGINGEKLNKVQYKEIARKLRTSVKLSESEVKLIKTCSIYVPRFLRSPIKLMFPVGLMTYIETANIIVGLGREKAIIV